MRSWLQVLTIALASAAADGLAHQDYAGDVHPRVVVERGQFAIYFHNTRDRLAYKLVVSTTGATLSPRRAIGKATDEVGSPIRRQHGGRSYVIPAWEREHKGQPFYLLGDGKGAPRRMALPWGQHRVQLVHDAAVSDRELVLAVTPGLQLFRFALQGPGVATTRLGEPYRIYDFPRASNLAAHRGSTLIGWIDSSQRLLLSSWTPSTGRVRTVTLAAKTDWNTTLSIGVIGDVLLLARHAPGPRGAEIKTLLQQLPL